MKRTKVYRQKKNSFWSKGQFAYNIIQTEKNKIRYITVLTVITKEKNEG